MKKKKKSLKRELIEFGVILGIFGFLYVTGLSTDVFGALQRMVMVTGVHNAGDGLPEEEQYYADYNLSFSDMEGVRISLEQFKGKTVFINIWATWCPPCVAEMPSINDLYLSQKENDDVVFLMISVDQDRTKVPKFMEKKEFDFPVFYSEGMPSSYSTGSIPTTVVVSPEGKVVYKKAGIANYDTNGFKDFLTNL
ncbi:TlpA disulfide reductase family protein [Flammeovirgaceae bacterium SG7u.111]|nr:TlpA disulfide reductase family protein [Flammeovirgaceae bacterium SG7u.132]WPO33086.1 TlpA disulfide reductase family protein [Flammeovirgaceae bacterium SG7u.111]